MKKSLFPVSILASAFLLLAACPNTNNTVEAVSDDNPDISNTSCSSSTQIVSTDAEFASSMKLAFSMAGAFDGEPAGVKGIKARAIAGFARGVYDYSDEYVTVSGLDKLILKNGFRGDVSANGTHAITFTNSSATAGYAFSATGTATHDLTLAPYDINHDGTKENVPEIISIVASTTPPADGTKILVNKNASVSCSGSGSAYIRGVTGTVTASDGTSPSLTLNKAGLTISKLSASAAVKDASWTYNSKMSASDFGGTLTLSSASTIELDFVLSSSSASVKGGKVYLSISFDKSTTLNIADLYQLYYDIGIAGAAKDQEAVTLVITTFMTKNNLSADGVSIKATVKNNANVDGYTKTFTGTEFVKLIMS